jgi:glucose/arabinose dehydrogenase
VGLAFLPDDQGMLITLRGGELKRWQPGKGLSAPISGVPQVWANGQGGLLDVALAPDFAQSRRVWLSYAESDASGKAGTAVGYGRLSEDATQLTNFTVVFRQQPKLSVGNHFGGRLVFDGKGYLFIGLGRTISAPPPRISQAAGESGPPDGDGTCRRIIPLSAGLTPGRRSGPTASAIRRAWR